MKKKIFSLLLAAVLAAATVCIAAAEDLTGPTWNVKYDGSSLSNDFDTVEMTEAMNDLLPGDSITFTVNMTTEADGETDYWMKNQVIQSFEDTGSGSNGAYTFELIYNGPDGEEIIYSSSSVGGDEKQGLHEVEGLEEYFYLGTLEKGEQGTLTLTIALDGATQGNGYQGTSADIQLEFAVEHRTTESSQSSESSESSESSQSSTPQKSQPSESSHISMGDPTVSRTSNPGDKSTVVVETGDELKMMPFLIISAVSGIALLVVVAFRLKASKQKRESK